MGAWQICDPVLGKYRDWRAPTEDDFACQLAQAQNGRMRFCHAKRALIVWDGALWRRDLTRSWREEGARELHKARGGLYRPSACAIR